MPTRRSIIGRSLARYLLAVCVVSLSCLARVEGRKCVCTSKACKEAGVDTCRTRFFCYTELIVTTGQEIGESTITRGCTEGATPLLCETKSWVTRSRSVNAVELSASPRVLVPWPRLKCCNSHDYCNADDDNDNDEDNDDDDNDESTWMRERKAQMDQTRSTDHETLMDGPTSTNHDMTLTLQPDRKYEDSADSADQFVRNRIRALHVAAFVLAVAALISVLASCYVVTRFLRSNRYIMDTDFSHSNRSDTEVDNYESENVHETKDVNREQSTETVVVGNNEQSQNIQPEISQRDKSLPSTSTADNISTDKDSNNFNQRNTAECISPPKKKASKRKIIDEHKKRSDEAYAIMKYLENKQHRDRFTVFALMGKYDQPSFGLYNVPPILPSSVLQTPLPLPSPVLSNYSESYYSEGTLYSESPSPLQASTNASIHNNNSTTEPTAQ